MDFELDDIMNMIDVQLGGASKASSNNKSAKDTIVLFENEEIMRESEHNPATVVDYKRVIRNHVENNIGSTRVDTSSTMRVYKPKITRNTISLFEYVAVITKLAKYIHSLPSLPASIEDVLGNDTMINNIINPSELAWILLRKGVYNPIFDRGYEKVSFSELMVNPTWDNLIESYFRTQHAAVQEELLNDMFVYEQQEK